MSNHYPIYGGCAVIVTYRCNAHCMMCHRHEHPSNPEDEFDPNLILKLPRMYAMNITGGEPFLRNDIMQIVENAHKRAYRVTISTNGTMPDRIMEVMRAYPSTALRVSVEGFGDMNDKIRGLYNGYTTVINLLLNLQIIGCKHIGISMTVSDDNYEEVLDMYDYCHRHGFEFATGAVHNSFFFESTDNTIQNKKEISETFIELAKRMRKEGTLKDKYRAIFNEELAKYVNGQEISFPCQAGKGFFAVSPYGDIMACVGSEQPEVMGHLFNDFWEVWNSEKAQKIREKCTACTRNCCMSGHVGVAMRKDALKLIPRAFFEKGSE